MKTIIFKRIIGFVGIAVFLIFIGLITYVFITHFGELINDPQTMRDTIKGYGMWGYLLFGLLNIFQIIFAPVPGHIITVSAGILFGFVKGIVINWFSIILGGSLAMLIARYYGQRMFRFLLDTRTQRFQELVAKRGLSFIFLLSIFPNPIGDGLFYLAGITNIPLRILIPVIALGRLPGIILAVTIGDRILRLGVTGWILGGFGLLCIIILYWLFGDRLEKIFDNIIGHRQVIRDNHVARIE